MNDSAFSLENKTIFVTGASSGLGATTAIECSNAGARLIISGRNEERLNNTFNQLYGQDHIKLAFDLTVKDNINEIVKIIPQLDGLVLCAGITKTIPVKFLSDESIDEMFQTNIFSSMLLIQKLLKSKKINKSASIVFISSIASNLAYKGNSIYAASKGAMNSFSKVLALELAVQKVRSNCILPGIIPTSMSFNGTFEDEQLLEEQKKYPLGFGEPSDIANGCIYLLSDAAKWITGSELTIDGGVSLS